MPLGVRVAEDETLGQQGTEMAKRESDSSTGMADAWSLSQAGSLTEVGCSSPSHLGRASLEQGSAVPLRRTRRTPLSPVEEQSEYDDGLTPLPGCPMPASLEKQPLSRSSTVAPEPRASLSSQRNAEVKPRLETVDQSVHQGIQAKFRRMATKSASLDPNVGMMSTHNLRRNVHQAVASIDMLRDEERMEDLKKEYAWMRYSEPIEFVRLALALVGIVFPIHGVTVAYREKNWIFAGAFYILASVYWSYFCMYVLNRRPTSNRAVKAFVYQEGLVHSRMQEAYVWTWLWFIIATVGHLGAVFSTCFKYHNEQHFYGSRAYLWAFQCNVHMPLILGYDSLTCTHEFKAAAVHKGYPGMANLHYGYWLRLAFMLVSGVVFFVLWIMVCGPISVLGTNYSWDFYLVYAVALITVVMQVIFYPNFARAVQKEERTWSTLHDSSTEEGKQMLRSYTTNLSASNFHQTVVPREDHGGFSIAAELSNLATKLTNNITMKKKRKSKSRRASSTASTGQGMPDIPELGNENGNNRQNIPVQTPVKPRVKFPNELDELDPFCSDFSLPGAIAEIPDVALVRGFRQNLRASMSSMTDVPSQISHNRFAALKSPAKQSKANSLASSYGRRANDVFRSLSLSPIRNGEEGNSGTHSLSGEITGFFRNCRDAASIMRKQWRFMAASSPDKFIFLTGCVLPAALVYPVGEWTFEDNYFAVGLKACSMLLGLAAAVYALFMSTRSSEEMILLAAADNQSIGAGQVYSTASILNSMLSGKPIRPGAVATEERIREAAAISCRWNTRCSWPILVKEGKGTRECWIMVQRTQLFRAALEAWRHRCKWFWMDTLSIPQVKPYDSDELQRLKAGACERLITTMTSVYATCKRVIVIETALPASADDENAYSRRLWTLQECVLNRNLSEVPLHGEIRSLDEGEPRAHLTGAGPGDAWMAEPGLTDLGTYEWVLHGEEREAAAKAEPRALEYLRFVERRCGSQSKDNAVALGQIFFRLLFEDIQVSCNFMQHLACNLLEHWEGDGTQENATLVLIDNTGWNPYRMSGSVDNRRLVAGKPGSLEEGNPVTWTLLVVAPVQQWSRASFDLFDDGREASDKLYAMATPDFMLNSGTEDIWYLCWMALSGRIVPCAIQKFRTLQGDLVLKKLRTCTSEERVLLDIAELDEHVVNWA